MRFLTGFNNNLAWNFGHVIATQQILCYRNAGVKPVIEEEFIDKYKTGTRPKDLLKKRNLKFLSNICLKQLISLKKTQLQICLRITKPLTLNRTPESGLKISVMLLSLSLFMMDCMLVILWL